MIGMLREVFDQFENYIDLDMSVSITNWNQIVAKYQKEADSSKIEPKRPLPSENESIWSWLDDDKKYKGYQSFDDAIEKAFLKGEANFPLVADSVKYKQGAKYVIDFAR